MLHALMNGNVEEDALAYEGRDRIDSEVFIDPSSLGLGCIDPTEQQTIVGHMCESVHVGPHVPARDHQFAAAGRAVFANVVTVTPMEHHAEAWMVRRAGHPSEPWLSEVKDPVPGWPSVSRHLSPVTPLL
jgi:hypothetical protein